MSQTRLTQFDLHTLRPPAPPPRRRPLRCLEKPPRQNHLAGKYDRRANLCRTKAQVSPTENILIPASYSVFDTSMNTFSNHGAVYPLPQPLSHKWERGGLADGNVVPSPACGRGWRVAPGEGTRLNRSRAVSGQVDTPSLRAKSYR